VTFKPSIFNEPMMNTFIICIFELMLLLPDSNQLKFVIKLKVFAKRWVKESSHKV